MAAKLDLTCNSCNNGVEVFFTEELTINLEYMFDCPECGHENKIGIFDTVSDFGPDVIIPAKAVVAAKITNN